jgi:hypothetical protein
VTFDDWQVWEELFMFLLCKLCSPPTCFAIDYVIRLVGEVLRAACLADYKVINEQFFALATHKGGDYDQDNMRLFDLPKPLLIKGPCWHFDQHFNKKTSCDGHAVFLWLKRQAEGTAAIMLKQCKAPTF